MASLLRYTSLPVLRSNVHEMVMKPCLYRLYWGEEASVGGMGLYICTEDEFLTLHLVSRITLVQRTGDNASAQTQIRRYVYSICPVVA